MASLNLSRPKTPAPKTHEGAPAARTGAAEQLARSVMSCLLWESEFYEDGLTIADRIRDLVPKVAPDVVAALAIQARQEMNLRHVPLLLVREMARHPSHRPFVADALFGVIRRADELSEFLSMYWQGGKEPLAKCVQKGLARAFVKFDAYSLAKYNREKAITLRDVLFQCHAKPKDGAQAFDWKRLTENFCEICWGKMDQHEGKDHAAVLAKLAIPDTWEVELSKSTDKRASWSRLLSEGKLFALAILRNLRNMSEAKVDDGLIRLALNGADVSRVLPFRFIAAARFAPRFEPELESALFRNVAAMPKLRGNTVVLVDVSGSMKDPLSAKSDMTRLDAACGLAMVAREVCESVRVFKFATNYAEVPPRRGFALRDAIGKAEGSTNLGLALEALPAYDRVIVITDEQSHDKVGPPNGIGYMLNVASAKNGVGYGAWNHIDGFSEAVIRFMVQNEAQQAR